MDTVDNFCKTSVTTKSPSRPTVHVFIDPLTNTVIIKISENKRLRYSEL